MGKTTEQRNQQLLTHSPQKLWQKKRNWNQTKEKTKTKETKEKKKKCQENL